MKVAIYLTFLFTSIGTAISTNSACDNTGKVQNPHRCRCGTSICLEYQYCYANRCSFYTSGPDRSPEEKFVQHRNKIRQKMAIGLRADFPKLRQLLTKFKGEYAVPPAIVFCGAECERWPLPDNFARPVSFFENKDGYSSHDESVDQCGQMNCLENSFVSILASFINKYVYYVEHRDICMAVAKTAPATLARTCNLRANTVTRNAFKCSEHNDDWWQLNRMCYPLSSLQCDKHEKCRFDVLEGYCRADEDFMKNICEIREDSQTFLSNDIVNEIWPVLGYSVNSVPVAFADKMHVTGAVAGECNTLRGLVHAINGNIQIHAFRELGMSEAVHQWHRELLLARSYLKSIINDLSDFRDLSKKLFPYIEHDKISPCPTGYKNKYEVGKTGTRTAPLCEDRRHMRLEDLNRQIESKQYFDRSNCFCRNGELDSNYGTETEYYNMHEFDQLYLMTRTAPNCDEFEARLPSVYRYCKNIHAWGKRVEWIEALDMVKPDASQIRVYSQDQNFSEKRRISIYNDIIRGIPDHEKTCGRLVSGVLEPHIFSNKGGNCVPFRSLHKILYKLEVETSGANGRPYLPIPSDGNGEFFCDPSFSEELTKGSFRQISNWNDHINPKYADICVLGHFLNTSKDSGPPIIGYSRAIEEAVWNTEIAHLSNKKVHADHQQLWETLEEQLTTVSDNNMIHSIAVFATEHYLLTAGS